MTDSSPGEEPVPDVGPFALYAPDLRRAMTVPRRRRRGAARRGPGCPGEYRTDAFRPPAGATDPLSGVRTPKPTGNFASPRPAGTGNATSTAAVLDRRHGGRTAVRPLLSDQPRADRRPV
ncbi:hypothetical protein TPA0910_82170 [Streptomyces hygroscopicus subsp. sporocinereus]|uniref:Uncharacterized protein n=1 Tax=Streptomyces hygroscopicus TaxID=1912 RepID=A0ABQ3UDV1_STRHY|nr:hypothetical protein TPA0910_82170 [Streptomyces hygroscopicus]